MPDPKQVPHLLKLLEDDSPSVQHQVMKELAAFGPGLENIVAGLPQAQDPHFKRHLAELFQEFWGVRLKEQWKSWFYIEDDYEKLEAALTLLAEYQSGINYTVPLKSLLDELAGDYRAVHGTGNEIQLSEFLFKGRQLKGNDEHYYDPDNSNLASVIMKKRGIPISLTCVYMLAGARLGFAIEGCNFPGHFLARLRRQEDLLFIDCYNGGRVFKEDEMMRLAGEAPDIIRQILHAHVSAESILARVLGNLVRAYQQAGQWEQRNLMTEFLKEIHPGMEEEWRNDIPSGD